MKTGNKDKYVMGNVGDFEGMKGYFIGQFMGQGEFPDLETEEVEISWKKLPTNFTETNPHFHRRGVEVNIVISGEYKVEINGEKKELNKGDFLIEAPKRELS